MNSKNIKVVDEHGIDRNASVMFGFELDGSGYVTYSIERDEENSNIFISKVLRNFDNTFNMIDIDDSMEKSNLVDIVKKTITNAVESSNEKNIGSSLTIDDGKIIKFINLNFNKEQKINVQKTYITTVKKEVIRVVEKFYVLDTLFEESKVVEDIFPTVAPVIPVENIEPITQEVSNVNLEFPKVENFNSSVNVNPISVTELNSSNGLQTNEQVTVGVIPNAIDSITVTESVVTPLVNETASTGVITPAVENNNLVFNASKETNLNAALGEVASTSTIPVENINPIREFGVDEQVVATSIADQNIQSGIVNNVNNNVISNEMLKKGGFANSKFFMVVAISFFLASCIFLGYEVFNYFQLTK